MAISIKNVSILFLMLSLGLTACKKRAKEDMNDEKKASEGQVGEATKNIFYFDTNTSNTKTLQKAKEPEGQDAKSVDEGTKFIRPIIGADKNNLVNEYELNIEKHDIGGDEKYYVGLRIAEAKNLTSLEVKYTEDVGNPPSDVKFGLHTQKDENASEDPLKTNLASSEGSNFKKSITLNADALKDNVVTLAFTAQQQVGKGLTFTLTGMKDGQKQVITLKVRIVRC